MSKERSGVFVLAGMAAVLLVVLLFGKDSLLGTRSPLFPSTTVGAGAPALAPSPVAPTPLPELLVRKRDGSRRSLAGSTGKHLVVHFWATWCPPCVEELPGLLAFSREMKGRKDVEVLAVSVDTDFKTVDDWLRKRKAEDLPVFLDPDRATAGKFGTEKFPETWFISPKGDVLEHVAGPLDWNRKDVKEKVTALLRS